MGEYKVLVSPKAVNDLDEIYSYVCNLSSSVKTAMSKTGQIETAILSLNELPYRHPKRTAGRYSNGRYRQIYAGNYLIIYRISETQKTVIIVTVCYYARNI